MLAQALAHESWAAFPVAALLIFLGVTGGVLLWCIRPGAKERGQVIARSVLDT